METEGENATADGKHEMENEKQNRKMVCEYIKKMFKDSFKKMSREGSSEQWVPCIFRVPERLRLQQRTAYVPRVVSIGPFHKSARHLTKDMEEHKVSYMYRLFRRRMKNSNETMVDDVMEECVDAMLEKAESARTCYAESLELNNVEFAQMMLLDGCFILELLCTSREKNNRSADPIFGNTLKFHNIRHDLLLLENQIPFFVLEKLFELTVKRTQEKGSGRSLAYLVHKFFGNLMNSKHGITKKMNDTNVYFHHILHLLHKCYLPPRPCNQGRAGDHDLEAGNGEDAEVEFKIGWFSWLCGLRTPPEIQPYHPIMKHSATELGSAGVTFEARKGEEIDMEFSTSCWFSWLGDEIPTCCIYNRARSSSCFLSWLCLLCGRTRFQITPLRIEDYTEAFLRNLIAFEQCSPCIEHHITSYAFLMDTLINSKEDVELLEKAKVLRNNLGAGRNASDLFHKICKEVILGCNFSFFEQWKEVHKYCTAYSRRNLASVKRNCASLKVYYFSNRWALISVIAALILFLLQVLQTVYTIRFSN